MGNWLSSAITAGAGLIGSMLGFGGQTDTNSTNLQAVRETNQAQRELAEYQYEKNLEQWHRENEYNSPSAQMSRLAQAGLNPHLVYGNGNAITPSAKSPTYEAPKLQAYHQDASALGVLGKGFAETVNNTVENYLKVQMQHAQLTQMQYQNEYTKQMTKNKGIEESILNVKQLGELLNNTDKEQKIAYQKLINEWYPKVAKATLENTEASTANLNATEDKIKADTQLAIAETAAQEAAASLNDAQRQVAYKLIEKYSKEIEGIAADIRLKNEQAAYYKMESLKAKFEADWIRQFGPGKNMIDSLFNSPTSFLYGVGRFFQSIGQFSNGIGLSIANGIGWNPRTNKIENPRSPVGLYLRGVSTMATGPAGSVTGFRLR